jgi:enediyne biosynthesis protein E4
MLWNHVDPVEDGRMGVGKSLGIAAVIGLAILGAWIVLSKPIAPNPAESTRQRPDVSVQPAAGGTDPAIAVLFDDRTAASKISMTYRNGETSAKHLSILESLGGGVAIIDFDGDEKPDLYFVGGGDYSGPDQKQIVGFPGKLYRNLGNGGYEDVTSKAGLLAPGGGKPWFYSHGVAVGDYNRDGWPDLFVTGWGQVALFRNDPAEPGRPSTGRKFVDVTQEAGLDRGFDWATSAAFGDLDGDGFPDLYVCQYVNWSWANHPACTYEGKLADVCPPRMFDGLPHRLFRNSGNGTFVDVSKEAGLLPGGPNASKGLGVLFVDVDGDGKPDIYVANDTVDNFLYLNQSTPGKIRLSERGFVGGVARDDSGTPNGSMGIDAGDPERLGRPSLFVTNYENEFHGFYRNDCKPGQIQFKHRTTASGIGAIGKQYVGWATAFFDADLDGWEDLFISNGHAIRYPGGKEENRPQYPVFLLNRDGKYRIATPALGPFAGRGHHGRGGAIGDLDGDGRIDLALSPMNEPAVLLRGTGGDGRHWISVRLSRPDRACIVGTRVVCVADGQQMTRFAKSGGAYLSSNDPRLHFGVGSASTVVLTLHWPDGSTTTTKPLPVDREYHFRQGDSEPEPKGIATK